MGEIKYEKKIEISEDDRTEEELYMEWAGTMWNKGYTVSLRTLMDELHVSRNWVNEYIQPDVSYVKYKGIFKGLLPEKDSSMVFFNKNELRSWLSDNSLFSRQTKVIDLEKFCSFEAIDQAIENAGIPLGINGKRHSYGYVAQPILNELMLPFKNVNERKRSQYAPVPIENFNWWESKKYHPADYNSTETCYREAFRHGMIKVMLLGKTIFVEDPKHPDTNYPMTVAAR